ncbi:MAG TPA: PrsW family intramembrane metalloprotease [Asanoa sp.]
MDGRGARTAHVHPAPRAHSRTSLLLPAFWVVLALTVVGAVRLSGFVRTSFAELPVATAVAVGLFVCYAVPLWLFVAALDHLEREPALLRATAVAWGGLVATTISVPGVAALHNLIAKLVSPAFAATWGSALAGPTVEEVAKALGVIAIVLVARAQLNSVLDGVVYGALVGLGFQVVEDIAYALNAVALAGHGDSVRPVIATFLLRGLLAGLWSHTLFAALAGAGIGYLVVRTDRSMASRVGAAMLAFGGAWTCHFLRNAPLPSGGLGGGPWLFAGLVLKGVPPMVVVALLVRAARQREADYNTAEQAAPNDTRIATAAGLHAFGSGHLRVKGRRYPFARAGMRGRRAVRRLQRAQAGLAVDSSRGGSGFRWFGRAPRERSRLVAIGHPEAHAAKRRHRSGPLLAAALAGAAFAVLLAVWLAILAVCAPSL